MGPTMKGGAARVSVVVQVAVVEGGLVGDEKLGGGELVS